MRNNKLELTEALNHTQNTEMSPKLQSNRCAARTDKKLIGGHFDKVVHKQLKLMAFEEDCSIQHLLGEALDYLFVNRGKPPIAKEGQ